MPIKKLLIAAALVLVPLGALADTPSASNPSAYYGPGTTGYESPTSQGWGGSGMTFAGAVNYVLDIFDRLIPVLVALAIVYFFIGIIRYIRNQGEHSNRTEILWSLVALFVLFSVWGILNLLANTFLSTGANSTGVNGYFGNTYYQNTNSFGGPR